MDSLRRVFGSCRFVYNAYIALARERYATGAKHPSGYDATKVLVTEARRSSDTAWLAEVSHMALSAAVQDAADAYQRFFDSAAGKIKGRRVGHPKFKSRRTARKSARFAENAFIIRGGWQNTGQGGGRLHLANITQDIAVNWHRPLPGYPSAATVREDPDGKFWVSLPIFVTVCSAIFAAISPSVASVLWSAFDESKSGMGARQGDVPTLTPYFSALSVIDRLTDSSPARCTKTGGQSRSSNDSTPAPMRPVISPQLCRD